MGEGLRTIGLGSIVATVCLAVATLSWDHLLMALAAVAVAWTFWSLTHQSRNRQIDFSLPENVSQMPKRRKRKGRIYHFPDTAIGGLAEFN